MVGTTLKAFPIADLYSHPDFNKSRMGKEPLDPEPMAKLLAENGWYWNRIGMLQLISMDDPLAVGWKEKAVKELTKQWKALQDNSDKSPKDKGLLEQFEKIRVKKGAIHPPKFMVHIGNYRLTSVYLANYYRSIAKGGAQPPILEVPAEIISFENEEQMLVEQNLDNFAKTQGAIMPSVRDQLYLGKEILRLKGIKTKKDTYLPVMDGAQMLFRRAFLAGTGQKNFGIDILDLRFPDTKIVERLCMDPKEHSKEYLRYGSVPQNLSETLVRCDPEKLAKASLVARGAGKTPPEPLTEKNIEDLFIGFSQGTNKTKIMNREEIAKFETSGYPEIINLTAKAIREKDTDLVAQHVAATVLYNAVSNVITAGRGVELERLVLAITSAQDQSVAIESCLKALKVKNDK